MRLFFLFFIFILNGCATPDLNTPIVYKMEIQQGNEIDSEMLLKLKPGMTKSQVKFILGTPLIADSFHKDRWDYLYVINTNDSTKNKLGFTERRHVVLNFEKELLKGITGEVIPSNGDLDVKKKEKLKEHVITNETNNAMQGEEDSWMEKIKFWESDETNQTIENETNIKEIDQKIKRVEETKQIQSDKKNQNKLEINRTEEITENKKVPLVNKEMKKEEDSWIDKIKFWESDEPKQIEVNEIKKEKIKDSIQNEKENQTEKIREKVIQEVEVENKMLDTKDSVNEVIRKDISQEKEEERSRVKKNNLREQAESKQDIIDSKSDEPDYFDLMLEKIGF
jgi:outer membrane protein assembly factor BamE